MPTEAEVIEGEVREVEEPRALAVVADIGMTATGPLALAGLSDEEFDRRLGALDTMRKRVARMQKALMVVDVDYGVIPGTGSKPTLLKPGAEKLCQAYGLAADFIPARTVGDGDVTPNLSYVTRCELHLGSLDGLVIAVGYGAANSWERKHRYRRGERICPSCGQPTIIKGKAEYGGGWVCFKKKGGCGSKWADGATEIEGQSVGDVENPDPFDLDVVLAKMSEKRAFIDATLRATAASGLFTQDIEDLGRASEGQRAIGEYDAPPERPELERRADGLVGTVARGKAPVDLQVRQTPDGAAWGFKLMAGRKGYQALAIGPLADALAQATTMSDAAIEGQTVTVWGRIEMVPWDKTIDGEVKSMPPFARIAIERMATADWILPADVRAYPDPNDPADDEVRAFLTSTEAESVPLFDEDDPARQADFDAAWQATEAALNVP